MKRFAVFAAFAFVLAACSAGGSRGHTSRTPAIGMDVRRSVLSHARSGAAPGGRAGEAGAEAQRVSGPPSAVVPDVRGMRFDLAVHRLWRAGIGFDLVYGRESDMPLWAVVEEHPTPGSDTPSTGQVELVLSLHHRLGAGVIGTVRCKPEVADLADPYCLGKLLKYS